MHKPVSSGRKKLGPINQPPWPTLSLNWISMKLLMSHFFYCRPPCRPHCPPQCIAMSATMSNSMSATMSDTMPTITMSLCEVSETLTEWKSKSMTDQQTYVLTGVGARDACLKRWWKWKLKNAVRDGYSTVGLKWNEWKSLCGECGDKLGLSTDRQR